MGYIYKITNNINQKVYIGKTLRTIQERWKQHIVSSQRLQHKDRPLYRAFNKYGIDNFSIEIIEEISDVDLINQRECYWIQYYNSFHYGYNATKGGEGKAIANYELIYSLYTNNNLTFEQIKHQTGYDYTTIKQALLSQGITHQKIQENRNKRTRKPVLQVDKNTNEIIQQFSSCIAAQQYMTNNYSDNSGSHINAVCSGKRKTAYGYKWQFAI